MDRDIVLSPAVAGNIDSFVEAARGALGEDLVAAVLFGSAAEGKLRATSDVNLLLVIRGFDRGRADRLREPFRAAHAAVRLDVMFLLESEIEAAMDAFSVKFSDILSRRRVLFGRDPFAELAIPPEAIRRRTRQVLLNLLLRMRERYALVSLREEQLALVVASVTGPLRGCAASILKLEGQRSPPPGKPWQPSSPRAACRQEASSSRSWTRPGKGNPSGPGAQESSSSR